MFWINLQKLSPQQFQRYTGVKLPTFDKMVEMIKLFESKNRNNRSRKHKYSVEDRVLIMLCYYREYPTYFHLGLKYNVSESTACRTVIYIENLLIKSGAFNLPKKTSIVSDTEIEVIVIDASESPIERPKAAKHQKLNYSGKKNDIPKNFNYS